MESFLKLILDRDIFYSFDKVPAVFDDGQELNIIKFLKKIIFKHDVMVEFEEVLKLTCASEPFTVKNDVIKKLIGALHSMLSSDIDSKYKLHVFRCIFQAFIISCKENERLPAIQFFVVLAHLLGMDELFGENIEVNCIVNAENFKRAFNVEISAPSEVSYSILRELLICFPKQSLLINSSETLMYYKWLKQLIKTLANTEPFQSIFLEIFLTCIDIDFMLVDKNLEHIMKGVLSQTPPVDENFNKLYERFLEYGLEMSAKFQRTTKFVRTFILSLQMTPTTLPEQIVLPLNFLTEFSKTVALTSTNQSLLLLDNMILSLAECYTALSENNSESQSLSVISNLLVAFLKEVKILTPSTTGTTLLMLIDKINSLTEVLKKFGSFVLSKKKCNSENIIKAHLQLCLYCAEVQSLFSCYKDSVLLPSDLGNSKLEKDRLCCLSIKQWNRLVKRVLKTNLEICYPICFQLALHKLRNLKLHKTTLAEDSTLKMILSQFELDLEKFDLFQQVTPEDVTIIISFLTTEQAKTVTEKIFGHILNAEGTHWKSWMCNSSLQENLTFIVNILSSLLKRTGSVLGSNSSCLKFSWMLDEYFDDNNNINKEYLKPLPEKLNSLLKNWEEVRKTRSKSFAQEKEIIRIFEMFKLLPVYHLNEDYRQLGLSFAVAGAMILARSENAICLPFESMCLFLASDVDASTCLDVGLCLKWLCQLVFERKEAGNHKQRVLESLIRRCPNTKSGLSQIEEMIGATETSRQDSPLQMLETKVTVYQELEQCCQRAKKRQADNDLIGTFRTKLARMISDEAKALEGSEIGLRNSKLFLGIFAIELHKAIKMNEEEQISVLMKQKFPSYFDFAIETLTQSDDEPSASFLTFILKSTPQLKKFLPGDSTLKIWKAFRHYEKRNWRLFCSNTDDEEFNVILSDLLQMTEKFFTSEPDQHLCNYFEIWFSFLQHSLESKRQKCQLLLQDFFRYIHDCDLLLRDLTIRQRIHLIKFYSFCVFSKEVVLTSHMLDTIIHVMVEFLDDSSSIEDFRTLFAIEVEAAASILLRQYVWAKNKVHLTFVLFKRALIALSRKCDVARQMSKDDIATLSACAFMMEKWVKLMVKKRKDFARTVPHFIATVISVISSNTILPAIKFYLINCINHFLSISDSHTVSYIMRVLNPGYQQVFNSIYQQFKKYHKYRGKI